jgi:phosphatidylserine decarboxylase
VANPLFPVQRLKGATIKRSTYQLGAVLNKEGIPTVIGLIVIAVFLGWTGRHFGNVLLLMLAGLAAAAVLFSVYFFRDPHRTPPDNPLAIVSPCDGTVIGIETVEEPEFIQGKANRIAIFMSVFSVHVNYVPFRGIVEYVRFFRGKYYRADFPEASTHNVHILTGLDTPYGRLAFKQSTGMIARRLVNYLKLGDKVETGQKFGIIKFGSRMEVFLPACAEISIKIGESVTAGESVIAVINEEKK